MCLFSRRALGHRFGNRTWRIRLGYVIVLGLISFTWVHVSFARVAADASLRVYAALAELPGDHSDSLRQEVVRELWARWIIPGSDSSICHLGNDSACASIRQFANEPAGSFMEARDVFTLMNPLPLVGIALGILVALVSVVATISQLINVDPVEIAGAA